MRLILAYTGNNSNQKSNKAPKYDKQGNKSGKPNIKAPKYARQGDKSGKPDNKAPKYARQGNKSGKPGKPAHALMKQAKNPAREQKAVDSAALRESLILKFDSLITSDNPRTLLSQIRQLLKDCPGALKDEDVFYSYATVEPIILACLTHEDAKTRKNAALVLQTIAEEYGMDIFGDDQMDDASDASEEVYLGNRNLNNKYGWYGFELKHHARGPLNNKQIRYADVLLMYAEACLIVGDAGTAKTYIDQVRSRVGLTGVPTADETALRHERRCELAMEGHRWFDLVRWGGTKAHMDAYAATETEEARSHMGTFREGVHEIFPIPVEEIELNPMEQNPGYN